MAAIGGFRSYLSIRRKTLIRKFSKRFLGCFVLQSHVLTKTVVNKTLCLGTREREVILYSCRSLLGNAKAISNIILALWLRKVSSLGMQENFLRIISSKIKAGILWEYPLERSLKPVETISTFRSMVGDKLYALCLPWLTGTIFQNTTYPAVKRSSRFSTKISTRTCWDVGVEIPSAYWPQ